MKIYRIIKREVYNVNLSLENEYLKIVVSEKGGELQSIYGKEEQQEYLWQGDSAIWPDRAPNLFPYIARMTNGTYTYAENIYHMQIHGFVMYRTLTGAKQDEELCFELRSDVHTLKQYPFQFVYRVKYKLQEKNIVITYEVENLDEKEMYFGIGGHPGFAVPFCPNTAFEDYELVFENARNPERILFSEDCFVVGKEIFQDLRNHKLSLRHNLFDQDAIVLENAGYAVRLQMKNSERYIRVNYPDMKYIGIWHMPHMEVPYVCLEPWSSLPSRKNIVEDLGKQENLIRLESTKVYRNTWSIQIH